MLLSLETTWAWQTWPLLQIATLHVAWSNKGPQQRKENVGNLSSPFQPGLFYDSVKAKQTRLCGPSVKPHQLTPLVSCKPLSLQTKRSMTSKMPSQKHAGPNSRWLQRGRIIPLLLKRLPYKDVRQWATGKQAVTDFGLKQPGEGLIQHTSKEEAGLQM